MLFNFVQAFSQTWEKKTFATSTSTFATCATFIFFTSGWARRLRFKKARKPFTRMKAVFLFRMGPKKILKTSRRRRPEKTLKTSRRHQVMLKGRAPMVVKGGANLCFKSRQPEPGGLDLKKTKKAGPQDSRSNLKIFCCVAPAARSSKK